MPYCGGCSSVRGAGLTSPAPPRSGAATDTSSDKDATVAACAYTRRRKLFTGMLIRSARSLEEQLVAVGGVTRTHLAELAVELIAGRAVESDALDAIELDRLGGPLGLVQRQVGQGGRLLRLAQATVTANRDRFDGGVPDLSHVDVVAVEPTIEGLALVGHVGPDRRVVAVLVGQVVLHAHDLGRPIALDVERI